MKRILVSALALGLLFSGSSLSYAAEASECPQGTKLRKIGNIRTATGGANTVEANYQITTSAANVRMIVLLCGGTACTVGLANTDSIGAAAAADYQMDIGGAANTTTVLDFTDQGGVDFTEGISYSSADNNLTALTLLACQ